MAPRVSGLHGKTHGMGKPMDIVMGKPMAQKVKVLTVVGGTVEKVHKYLASYFGGSFIIFDESN